MFLTFKKIETHPSDILWRAQIYSKCMSKKLIEEYCRYQEKDNFRSQPQPKCKETFKDI